MRAIHHKETQQGVLLLEALIGILIFSIGILAMVALHAAAIGYAVDIDGWNVGPHLGITYSRAAVDAYRERDLSGSGLALSVSGITARSLLGHAGVRVSRPLSRTGYVLVPQISAEYGREFERDGIAVTTAFDLDAEGNRLRLRGDSRDADFVDVGVGLVLLLPNGWIPFAEYPTTLGQSDLDRHRLALGLRVEL
jgi:outer membrane autotransporter protein